ncbi:MAG: GAF domain-containing protein [Planctomycetota bacterium]|jgi:signal transduction protein with GAF and PtsI domain
MASDPHGSGGLEEGGGRQDTRMRDLQNLHRAHMLQARKLRMYEQIHPLFLQPTQLQDNMEKVMDILLNDMDVEAGSIILIDPDAGEFFFASARGPVAEEIKKIRFPVDRGIAGAAAQGRQSLAVSNVSQDPRFYREITDQLGFEVRSLLAVPVLFQGESIGVVELINKRDGDDFLGQEVEAVEKTAALLAILIALGEHLIEIRGA